MKPYPRGTRTLPTHHPQTNPAFLTPFSVQVPPTFHCIGAPLTPEHPQDSFGAFGFDGHNSLGGRLTLWGTLGSVLPLPPSPPESITWLRLRLFRPPSTCSKASLSLGCSNPPSPGVQKRPGLPLPAYQALSLSPKSKSQLQRFLSSALPRKPPYRGRASAPCPG